MAQQNIEWMVVDRVSKRVHRVDPNILRKLISSSARCVNKLKDEMIQLSPSALYTSSHSVLGHSSHKMAQRARQATQQVATGGYPLMTVPQIGEIFHALSIPVDTADLNKPTAQTAITVYTNLLDVLVGAHPELVDNPRTALLGMMEYKVSSITFRPVLADGTGPLLGRIAIYNLLQTLVSYESYYVQKPELT